MFKEVNNQILLEVYLGVLRQECDRPRQEMSIGLRGSHCAQKALQSGVTQAYRSTSAIKNVQIKRQPSTITPHKGGYFAKEKVTLIIVMLSQ